jgi:hypothetical protein
MLFIRTLRLSAATPVCFQKPMPTLKAFMSVSMFSRRAQQLGCIHEGHEGMIVDNETASTAFAVQELGVGRLQQFFAGFSRANHQKSQPAK